jgi:hypothetical protein
MNAKMLVTKVLPHAQSMAVVIKNNVPLLWLDTSVFSHIGRARSGPNTDSKFKERLERLEHAIKEKVRQGSLICIKADQDEEVCQAKEYVEPIRSVMAQLTREMSIDHRMGVFLAQTARAMDAYLANQSHFDIPFSDVSQCLDRGPGSNWVVRVDINNPALEGELRRVRDAVCEEWEHLRKRCVDSKVTYDQKRLRELDGFYEYVSFMRRGLESGEIPLGDARHSDWSAMLLTWRVRTGKMRETSDAVELSQFLEFLRSPHCHAMPIVEIQACLLADLLTGNVTIRRGDWMDIKQLSAVLPYCNFVLADAAMAERLRQRKINQRWGCKVYCLKQADALIRDLNNDGI